MCWGRPTINAVRHCGYIVYEGMYVSKPPDYAICQTLRVFYLWKYDNFEAVWQRPLSDISSLLLCESMFMLRPSDDSRCQNLRVRLYPPFVNNVSHLLSFLQYKCSYSLHWSLNNLFLYLFALTILCLRCISEFKMLYLVLMISEYWHGP